MIFPKDIKSIRSRFLRCHIQHTKKGADRPSMKPNDNPLYIHTNYNHPTPIVKHIPRSIYHRLSDNSFRGLVFNKDKECYETPQKYLGFS